MHGVSSARVCPLVVCMTEGRRKFKFRAHIPDDECNFHRISNPNSYDFQVRHGG